MRCVYKKFSKSRGEKDVGGKTRVIIKSMETVVKTGRVKIKKLRTYLLSVHCIHINYSQRRTRNAPKNTFHYYFFFITSDLYKYKSIAFF